MERYSHLYVVLATNLYLPRYNTELTGDKRIQLELVRLCGIETLVLMPQNGLIQNRGLPAKRVSKLSDYSIPCLIVALDRLLRTPT